MSNGSRDLNTATAPERSLAVALIAVAAAFLAGIFAIWAGLLPNLSHTGARWVNILLILIILALGISMVLGGRGFAYGPKRKGWSDRFNLQAGFGAAALLLSLIMGGVIFLTTEPSANEKFGAKQSDLERNVKDLSAKVDKIQNELTAETSVRTKEFAVLSNTVADFKNRLDAVDSRIGAFDRSSANYTIQFRAIEDGIKSLSDRIDRLEKAPGQVKP